MQRDEMFIRLVDPNRGLNELVQKHGLSYIRRHFSYSILEIFSKNEQGRKQALVRETYWKDVINYSAIINVNKIAS